MSAWKATAITLLMVIFSGLVKAHVHFIRLALLAILGLLGMYLLHKLAQDWNKITGGGGGGGGGSRPPRPQRIASVLGMASRFFRLSKRSVDSQVTDTPLENLISKFTSVLYFDPIGCARKFVCYSASKPVANLTKNEFSLLQLFQSEKTTNGAFRVFQEAAKLGRTSKNVTLCEKTYKACYLSTRQLLTFYGYF